MFLNLIMLAGVAGAAVPLVLHLLNRARYRTVDWGAMMFLSGADPRQQRRSRIKQWLMLALRMGLVALLAVTLSRPLLGARWNWGQEEPMTAVILLDRSASMAYDENGHTRLDEAREAVRQILSTLHRGDQAALIALGAGAGHTPAPRPTPDLGALVDRLAGEEFLDCGYGAANMADGLKTAADVFDQNPSSNRALFVVCDRQALNWDQVDGRLVASWRTRTAMPGPGTFEAKRREIPSSGWMRITSVFGSSVAPGVPRNSAWGSRLKWSATSVMRRASRFPARR